VFIYISDINTLESILKHEKNLICFFYNFYNYVIAEFLYFKRISKFIFIGTIEKFNMAIIISMDLVFGTIYEVKK
jgi:hypothetical protein